MTGNLDTIEKIWFQQRWKIIGIVIMYGFLFSTVWNQWAQDCWNLEDFSHCLLIPCISGAILYQNRKKICQLNLSSGNLGLVILCGSLLIYFYGLGVNLNVFKRIGALGSLVGLIGYLFGTRLLKNQVFAFFYIFLCIPIPFVLYSKFSIMLRGIVTRLTASILQIMQIPAINDANVLIVGEHHLGVVDACSGIRSIMAIFSIAILFTYLFKSGIIGGAFLALLTLPVAIAMNILRVLLMAYFIYKFGIDLTIGVPHQILGFSIFFFIVLFMYLGWIFISWFLQIEQTGQKKELAV